MVSIMNPTPNFTETCRVMSGLLDRVSQDDMTRSTPCAGWTVHDLVTHVIVNQYFFAGAAGSTALGDDDAVTAANAVDRYRRSTEATLGAYGAEGTLERELTTPFGTFPGAMVLSVAFADQLTHCWDLARAIDATLRVDDELAHGALAAWTAFIQEDYRNGDMFAEAASVDDNASAMDRLAAFTGREV